MAPRNTGVFTMFDVLYEDGSRRSNRKVPSEILGGLDGDEPARTLIEAQDDEIAKASGRQRPVIAELQRSPVAKAVKVPFAKKK
ncbi:hypothetical protein [Roseomonas sp. 18066]|uniref:hypothetical protein n=1 Tax=Roseomonas sp. 18066 TaxID=2681412 RepID=UPI001359F53A|nr:hypothetical protein [Roseomonas sp. 18066]